MNRNNLVVILTGNCFILAFNMLYDFLVLEKKEYHSFILWNMIFYLILFVGNLYIFLLNIMNIIFMFLTIWFAYIFL